MFVKNLPCEEPPKPIKRRKMNSAPNKCQICHKTFETPRGLSLHLSHHKKAKKNAQEKYEKSTQRKTGIDKYEKSTQRKTSKKQYYKEKCKTIMINIKI